MVLYFMCYCLVFFGASLVDALCLMAGRGTVWTKTTRARFAVFCLLNVLWILTMLASESL